MALVTPSNIVLFGFPYEGFACSDGILASGSSAVSVCLG